MKLLKKLLGILSLNYSNACSCFPPGTLCKLVNYQQNVLQNDILVVSGIKVKRDSLSLKIKIIDVLTGNENRDTIMIWESYEAVADSFFCSYEVDYGVEIGDTMIIAVRPIDTLTIWGNLDDYIFFNRICITSSARFENDSVYGFIKDAYPNWSKMPYSQFKNNFNSLMTNCPDYDWTSIKALEKVAVSLYPNPVHNSLIIEIGNIRPKETLIRLFDIEGKVVRKLKVDHAKTLIDLSLLNSGFYVVEIANDGFVEKRKIIIE